MLAALRKIVLAPVLPVLDLDFLTEFLDPRITFTRASSGTYFDSAGVLQTAGTNIRRLDYDPITLAVRGTLIEEQRTNLCLWNRDYTDVAWVKVTVTAAKDQTGIDGSANSASSLTSTAGNGTTLQAFVLSAASRTFSVYVKRITGTGNIDLSQDGATWTTLTGLSSSVWTRYTLTASQLNPTCGFRIVTSGDAIAVDYTQYEAASSASSVVATTTASVTRSADVANIVGGPLANLMAGGGVALIAQGEVFTTALGSLASLSDGTTSNRFQVRFQSGLTPGFLQAIAGAVPINANIGSAVAVNTVVTVGASGGTTSSVYKRTNTESFGQHVLGLFALNQVGLGGTPAIAQPLNGRLRRVLVFNRNIGMAGLRKYMAGLTSA